jgi:DNA-binding LytR/AlgR family response regulator
MIRVVLVDNEKPLLDELDYLLKKYESIQVLDTFTDSIDALKNIEILKPDAVFLDIDMPILSGLNLAREIMTIDNTISIIFITGFNTYAVEAFEINAVDYIVKPVRIDRLNLTIDKLNTMNQSGLLKQSPKTDIIDLLEDDNTFDFRKIAVFDGEEYHLISSEDILYIQVESKYTDVITKNKIYNTKKTLDFWESRLKKRGFFRCHRSYIINLKHIIKISPMFKNNYILRLQGIHIDIPVSKNHLSELKTFLDL